MYLRVNTRIITPVYHCTAPMGQIEERTCFPPPIRLYAYKKESDDVTCHPILLFYFSFSHTAVSECLYQIQRTKAKS